MTKPFFSIIIPALNEEKYLPHLLDDLTKQTFRDFEVILVDGNSSDATVAKANLLPNLFLTSQFSPPPSAMSAYSVISAPRKP